MDQSLWYMRLWSLSYQRQCIWHLLTSWDFPTLLITSIYDLWCKGHKCDLFGSLKLSICFLDRIMGVAIIWKSSYSTFSNYKWYAEMTDTCQLWGKLQWLSHVIKQGYMLKISKGITATKAFTHISYCIFCSQFH